MKKSSATFSILITTKDRRNDLAYTLQKIGNLLQLENVRCIVCDDGSSDTTFSFISENYPEITLIRNTSSKGLIYSRNRMMAMVNTDYAISIDDDLHFVTQDVLYPIATYFDKNPKVAVLGFRIFWSKDEPEITFTDELPMRTKSYGGGANVFRMTAWHKIPPYPSWFVFYGEEDFASYQLFKKELEVHYFPEILVNHRVDIKSRKNNIDFVQRTRRSLRAGWSLFFLFLPWREIPRKMAYSIWMQFRLKILKGDIQTLKGLLLAIFDLLRFIPKIIQNKNRLSITEYKAYQNLPETKLYWQPKK